MVISVHHNLGSQVIVLPILGGITYVLTSTHLAIRDRSIRIRSRSRIIRGRKIAELTQIWNTDQDQSQTTFRIRNDLPLIILLGPHLWCFLI